MTENKNYPDTVGILKFKDGTFEVYPDLADIAPSVKYIRCDASPTSDRYEKLYWDLLESWADLKVKYGNLKVMYERLHTQGRIVPDGYVAVPLEPTEEMIKAIPQSYTFETIYKAMIAAAQKGGKNG